jgi:predicted small metal-binding protein
VGCPRPGQGGWHTSTSEGEPAVKELRCREIGFDCDAVVHGETVDEVMAQAGPHAKEAHGVDVTPEMAGQIRTLVHDA